MLSKNPESWLAQRVTRRGAGYVAVRVYVLVDALRAGTVPGTGPSPVLWSARRARCSARARAGALQALERCARPLPRECASFAATALRTKLGTRTSRRTQSP